eukprot:UN32788
MKIKAAKLSSISGSLKSFLAEKQELKYLGEKAFVAYVRSLFLEKDKEVFQPDKMDFPSITQSMGLPGTPMIKGTNINSKIN